MRGQPVRFLRTFTGIFVSVAALTAPASSHALSLEEVGAFDQPTYVTSDPGDPDRLFVLERPGQIQLIEAGNTTTFLDIDGAGSASSMAFSPEYATDGLFYVAYVGVDDPSTAGEDESAHVHIDEFSSDGGNTADPVSRREVLTIKYQPSLVVHTGGQLNFGRDGYLYASTGDGPTQAEGDPEGDAQNIHNLLGKILRIDPTGSSPGEYTVPDDNPFAGAAGCADGCDEIWSYGLRNPWRFSFDRVTGDLVIGDVGHISWEEIDFETGPDPGRGDNFGWNCREGAHDFAGPGEPAPVCVERVGTFTEPVFEYPDPGCAAVIGGYVVRDRALEVLYGRYLYGDWCTGELRSLNLGLPTASGDRSEGLSVPSVTSFGEDADCRIYAASQNGTVYRLLEPAGAATVGCEPPDTSINSGPADGSTTSDNTPTFDFSSTEPNSSFECQVDGGRFFGCTPSHTTDTLSDGGHTFEVRALNPAGKRDPTPALRTFTVDTTSPSEAPPVEPVPLTLELKAKKQPLKKKLKFFATASVASNLVAKGKKIKKTTKQLAVNQRTKLTAKLKRKKKSLARRLDRKGRAKVKIRGTATAQNGIKVSDKVKVKLKD